MSRSISVIIPLFNGTGTIEACLAAACASPYPDYEVGVVDDASTDNSVEMIERYPCRLIRLNALSGASKARNTGAQHSRGETLFFIDADCVMLNNTLDAVAAASTEHRGMVVGGTYTAIPYDNRFFSTFQSIFVHYNETRSSRPDYIATHAMVIKADTFRKMRGFREDFLPILEDVEFSHRLCNAGVGLVMDPRIRVQHIFNYTLARSLKNACRKAFFWTRYSLHNRDLFRDSGTASLGLIFITHKLREVLAAADRITVMRAGRVVGSAIPMETNEQKLASMMVGREVILTVQKGPAKPGEEILRVTDLHVRDVRDLESVLGVSLSVRAGEVLGVAGVQGNGQTELAEALTGLRHIESGHFSIAGVDLTGKPPRPITETGMAHIPEDRQRHGLVLSYSVADNMVLCDYYQDRFSKGSSYCKTRWMPTHEN